MGVNNRQTISLLLFVVLLVMVMVMPTAFLVEMPGHVMEVSGPDTSDDIISVDGAHIYPSDTTLYMTTVASSGGADAGATGVEVVGALLHPHWQVLPVRLVYPEKISRKEQEEHAVLQMEDSQSSAEVVALEKLGYKVSMTLIVSEVSKDSPAFGKLKEGDILRSITFGEEQAEATSYMNFISVLASVPAGSEVTVGYEREGAVEDVVITTEANEADESGWVRPGSRLGIGLTIDDVKSDVEVNFSLEDVGGPSAGTMFALGIYDELTKGSLGGKAVIAGTGTISQAGEVGKIGGIDHKMRGAADVGIKYFLAPATNCGEVVGNIPDGMQVYAIHTFDEAIEAVEAIGQGATDDLATCESYALKGNR